MKELTIEEKAKAYDEIIEKANKMHHENCEACQMCIEELIPELAESEDEKIRKGLIKAFGSIGKKEWGGINVKNAIAWIEKQGEHANFINKIQIGDKVTRNEDGELVNLSQLNRVAKKDEKQNEQNPDNIDNKFISMRETKPKDISEFLDRLTTVEQEFLWEHIAKIRKLDKEEQKSTGKVKPRFKFGNWVVIDSEVLYIKEVTEDGYLTDEGGLIPFRCDKEAHLWTIQDVKEGDVLACNEEILLFKSYSVQGRISLYCWYNGLTNNFNSKEVVDTSLTTRNKICPATKKQRDTLMKAMADAGYTFDFEKKELKKIEQKPAEWSEEDELHIRELESLVKRVWAIAEHENDKDTIHKMSDLSFFLKTLKPQLKQEWSERDETILKILNEIVEATPSKDFFDSTKEKCILWLKSLRPQNRWKPSDEQMDALETAVSSLQSTALESLYQKLIKLM